MVGMFLLLWVCNRYDTMKPAHPTGKVGQPTKRKVMGCLEMPAAPFGLTRRGRWD